MASGTSGRGGLGWVILAAALAVPGFLFYNWWSHLKAERDHAISAKASKRADGDVFQTPPPASGRLVNPISSSTSAPSSYPVPAAAAAASRTPAGAAPVGAAPLGAAPLGATPAGSSAAPVAGTMPSPAAPAEAAAKTSPAGATPAAPAPGGLAAAPATAKAPGAAPSAVTLSTTSTIVLLRDPMESPLDIVRLQEAAQAEADRLAAIAEANRPRPREHVRKRVQAPIENFIELQGIVAKADGDNLAIINGSTVNPGESFSVEHYAGKVKVVRITASEVTLEYNRRKFKLNVNAE